MKLPDLTKETKKLRLSIWHVGRQPNKWEDYLYFYIQSRYKAIILSCPNANYSSWKRCKSLRGVLIPFKFSIIFQNQFQVESNLTRAKSDS